MYLADRSYPAPPPHTPSPDQPYPYQQPPPIPANHYAAHPPHPQAGPPTLAQPPVYPNGWQPPYNHASQPAHSASGHHFQATAYQPSGPADAGHFQYLSQHVQMHGQPSHTHHPQTTFGTHPSSSRPQYGQVYPTAPSPSSYQPMYQPHTQAYPSQPPIQSSVSNPHLAYQPYAPAINPQPPYPESYSHHAYPVIQPPIPPPAVPHSRAFVALAPGPLSPVKASQSQPKYQSQVPTSLSKLPSTSDTPSPTIPVFGASPTKKSRPLPSAQTPPLKRPVSSLPGIPTSSFHGLSSHSTSASVRSVGDGKRPLPRLPGGVLPSKSLDRGTSGLGKLAGGGATLPRANTLSHIREGRKEDFGSPEKPKSLVKSEGTDGGFPIVGVAGESSSPPSISVEEEDLSKMFAEIKIIQPPSHVPIIQEPCLSEEATSSSTRSVPPPPIILPDLNFPDLEEEVEVRKGGGSNSPSRPTVTFASGPSTPAREKSEAEVRGDVPTATKSSTAREEQAKVRGGIVCEGCREIILGRLVSGSEGHYWHPKCFKCTTCALMLEHVSSYEHEGKIYCHLDYHELFTTRCYTCKTPIVDERFFTITDPSLGTPRYYHELHFFCSECGNPFLDPSRSSAAGAGASGPTTGEREEDEEELTGNINLFKGHPYCDKCHVRLHAPKCKKCRKPIAGEVLEALGGKWHEGCLACESCEQPFDNLRIFEHEGLGLCENCFGVLLKTDI